MLIPFFEARLRNWRSQEMLTTIWRGWWRKRGRQTSKPAQVAFSLQVGTDRFSLCGRAIFRPGKIRMLGVGLTSRYPEWQGRRRCPSCGAAAVCWNWVKDICTSECYLRRFSWSPPQTNATPRSSLLRLFFLILHLLVQPGLFIHRKLSGVNLKKY